MEHQHHQALDARRQAEAVAAVAHVREKVAVEQRLALLGQAQRVVELGARLARHEPAQKLHVGARDLHVHHEISPRETEQDEQVVLAHQHRVHHQPAVAIVQDGQGKRQLLEAVDHLAHHIRRLVAKEQAAEHLNLAVRAQPRKIELAPPCGQHQFGVAGQVGKRHGERKVGDQALHLVLQRGGLGVVAAVGGHGARAIVLDVLGGHRRAHEDEVVLEISPLQDLGGDRVEEGLGQLGLVVVHQQTDVVQLDLLPHRHGLLVGLEFLGEPAHALAHAQVVELDALALGALLCHPVAGFKPVLGPRRFGAEQAVVPVEAVHHGLGYVGRQWGVQALRKHGQAGRRTEPLSPGAGRSPPPRPRGRATPARCWNRR